MQKNESHELKTSVE